MSRAARPGSLTVDYKHTQVACMACLSSDGHGGAGCLKGVCSTHRHPCRWACRCQTAALTRVQQVDVGTAKQGSVCLQEKPAAPWERRRKGRILTVTNNCETDTCVV